MAVRICVAAAVANTEPNKRSSSYLVRQANAENGQTLKTRSAGMRTRRDATGDISREHRATAPIGYDPSELSSTAFDNERAAKNLPSAPNAFQRNTECLNRISRKLAPIHLSRHCCPSYIVKPRSTHTVTNSHHAKKIFFPLTNREK